MYTRISPFDETKVLPWASQLSDWLVANTYQLLNPRVMTVCEAGQEGCFWHPFLEPCSACSFLISSVKGSLDAWLSSSISHTWEGNGPFNSQVKWAFCGLIQEGLKMHKSSPNPPRWAESRMVVTRGWDGGGNGEILVKGSEVIVTSDA